MADSFSLHCLSIDLEVGKKDGKVYQFAGVRGDTGQSVIYDGKNLEQKLTQLDRLADGASYLLGHNILGFDVPILQAQFPDLNLLSLPIIDTLRLNPLCFPRNPYHHLVKHYQDGQLLQARRNDPDLDARLTLTLFEQQKDALKYLSETTPELVLIWHWLLTQGEADSALSSLFTQVRNTGKPADHDAREALSAFISTLVCSTRSRRLVQDDVRNPKSSWSLAYVLSWLSVSGGNSVLPPWVLYQFPGTVKLLRELRDQGCEDPKCAWCAEHHNPVRVLKSWFGFDAFRAEPTDDRGRSLQGEITAAMMCGISVLGILPTGAGKSVCYQVPALSRYTNTGALTIVISPLQALMSDQIAGLKSRQIDQCETLNGMLSLPERSDVLEKIRLGDTGILIVSPEQLRNRGFRRAIAQREIGAWVLDEAHCLSKWGHDFRPDYRYVGRFIKQQAGNGPIPPIMCLTATAKPEVIEEIIEYFISQLGTTLKVFEGGHERKNLEFSVVMASESSKLAQVHAVLEQYLSVELDGGAIVYTATRKSAEEFSTYLQAQGWAAGYFHAGLPPEKKKNTQRDFISGGLRVIAATNAFGMGIDKPDVRLVIHADIPGSLENYLQEAGRAGRDLAQANCVLIYTPEDVDRQFNMLARSRLSQKDINAVLRAIRNLDRKNNRHSEVREVIATPGEILAEDDKGAFEADHLTDDTRVKTAVSWLEEAQLMTREENRVSVFPSSLRKSIDETRFIIAANVSPTIRQKALLDLVTILYHSDIDEGVSTDELMIGTNLTAEKIREAMHDLESLAILSNDVKLTVFVHQGVENSTEDRIKRVIALETDLIALLREEAPDLQPGDRSMLHMRQVSQRLKDNGHEEAHPERIRALLGSIARDGAGDDGGGNGSLEMLRTGSADALTIRLKRQWVDLTALAEKRRAAGTCLMQHLLTRIDGSQRGKDLLVETTQGEMMTVLKSDMVLRSLPVENWSRLLDRGLMWLHEQEVIRLNRGLTVFRSAMTLHLESRSGSFRKPDYKPLKFHYDEQTFQVHVMLEYAQKGFEAIVDALNLVAGYFSLGKEEFVDRYFAGRKSDLLRQTTPESWDRIVDSLGNRAQKHIVADDSEDKNILVLAGPGSGKTRVLVHRLAYLIRCQRENPRGIIALSYNRHTANDIRKRLWELIGTDAAGVTILTCHAIAMRLVGASFAGMESRADGPDFDAVIDEAIRLLQGRRFSDIQPEDAGEARDRLLAGYRWLLVDEYQDIDSRQYALISALAGRSISDNEQKLNMLAVGDDDQNIYSWNGASVEFIRAFETDYNAQHAYLVENYRSTRNIIDAANQIIGPAGMRMKQGQEITINRSRSMDAPGGRWQQLDDVVAHGRVQIITSKGNDSDQAQSIMTELSRLESLDPDWDWSRVAVIARQWETLNPVRAWCELNGVQVQVARDSHFSVWSLRETQVLVSWLLSKKQVLIGDAELDDWLLDKPDGHWWDIIKTAIIEYLAESAGAKLPPSHLLEWLAEYCRDIRRQQQGLLLTTTHGAKGLEFDHVAILDGGWHDRSSREDHDAPRRLFYVAMTRASQGLLIARQSERPNPFLTELRDKNYVVERAINQTTPIPVELGRIYQSVSLRDVDLGFAGRFNAGHQVHGAINELQPGDPLSLSRHRDRWYLLDEKGREVSRMSTAYVFPTDKQFVHGCITAILRRSRDQTHPDWAHTFSVDEWEVVVPELVFAPG